MHPGNSFEAVVTHLVAQLTEVKMFGACTASKKIIEEEARRYYESGNCSLRKKEEIYSSFNPTLLEPVTLRWRVNFSSCPFESYLALLAEEITELQDNDQVIRLCRKALRNLVVGFYQKRDCVEFTFHLDDPLNCATNENDFDVIDCGDLSDRVGLVNVLTVCGAKLRTESESVLLTDVSTWISAAPSVQKFVEEDLLLGMPSNLMPSLYGMRLAFEERPVRPIPLDYDQLLVPLLPLRFKTTLPFENVTLDPSPPLQHSLERLRKACFIDCRRYETPLTFQYVLNGLIRRGADKNWMAKLWAEAPGSQLARQTLDCWFKGQLLRLLSFEVPFSSIRLSERASLRLALKLTSDSVEELHIDNLHIRFNMTVDDSVDSIQVSFLLPVDLLNMFVQENYEAILTDQHTAQPIVNVGLLKNMKQFDFDIPHPLAFHHTAPNNETFCLRCIEMEDRYVIHVCYDALVKGKRRFISKQFSSTC